MKEHGIEEVVVHAPYIINLANTTKEGYIDFAIEFLREELKRAEAVGATSCSTSWFSRRGWCGCWNKPNHLRIKPSSNERSKKFKSH